jgi:SAM-dependent methyltransferase
VTRDQPKRRAHSEDFEFEALSHAENYRRALFAEFGDYLCGDVLQVGAGIGQMTELLEGLPAVRRALAVEPDARFRARHRQAYPHHEVLEGTAADLPPGTDWDAVLSINVLEHIQEDEAELKLYSRLLGARRGTLCLFLPARREIYAPIDRDFGHFRRYTRPELSQKLVRAGFEILRLSYFNFVGYFVWWLNFCILGKRTFEPAEVRFYDRTVFPVVHWLESRLLRPPLGQSLIAVAKCVGK